MLSYLLTVVTFFTPGRLSYFIKVCVVLHIPGLDGTLAIEPNDPPLYGQTLYSGIPYFWAAYKEKSVYPPAQVLLYPLEIRVSVHSSINYYERSY